MSNIVWSAENGWNDGPEVTVRLDSSGRIACVGFESSCPCGVPGCSGTGAAA